MKEKKPTVRLVFDRKHQATKSNAKDRRPGLVQIEVMHQRKRKYISTGIKVYTDQWKQDKEQHIVGSAYAAQYNDTIERTTRAILDKINIQEKNGCFDLESLDMSAGDSISVADYARKVIGTEHLSIGTRNNLEGQLAILDQWPRFSDITKVTRVDVEKYVASLTLRPSTIRGRVALLHRIFRRALEDGVIGSDPAAPVSGPKGSTRERVKLNEEEVAMLAAADLPEYLREARDAFIFQCFTGLAYVDLATLTPEMIVNEGGSHYIVRRRQKTKIQYRVKLLKPAVEIMERHNWHLVLPSCDTYDQRLKRIEAVTGIGKHLSSHVARHTFATWTLSHGTPIEIVSKMLGHTNIRTTQIYAKILAKDVDAQFDELDKLFTNPK